MSKMETDKKLELVRTIRMQNQYDRQLLKYREGILYPEQGKARNGEIFSLEEAAAVNTKTGEHTEGSIFKGLRLRFMIAMVLFLGFVYCDVQEITVDKYTTGIIWEMIQVDQHIDIPMKNTEIK